MNFRPELAAKVMAGEKTVTRRLVSDNPRSPWWRERCSLKPGRTYAVCPGRGKHAIGRIRVCNVRAERFELLSIDDEELRREGFNNWAEFRRTWCALHGPRFFVGMVWRIEFKPELPHEREDE